MAIPSYSEGVNTITDDALFKQLKGIENAEYVNINSFLMSMGRMAASGEEKKFLENVKSMRIIEFAACTPEARAKYVDIVSSTELKDYMPAQEDMEKKQRTRIYIRVKDEIIKNIIIAQLGTQNYLIMQINGNLTIEDMDNFSKSDSDSK